MAASLRPLPSTLELPASPRQHSEEPQLAPRKPPSVCETSCDVVKGIRALFSSILFVLVLYVSFRLLACNIFHWQCRHKTIRRHWDDLGALVFFSAALSPFLGPRSSGPTLVLVQPVREVAVSVVLSPMQSLLSPRAHSPLGSPRPFRVTAGSSKVALVTPRWRISQSTWDRAVLAFGWLTAWVAMFVFSALGEGVFGVSLDDKRAWQAPAVFLIVGVLLLAAGAVLLAFRSAFRQSLKQGISMVAMLVFLALYFLLGFVVEKIEERLEPLAKDKCSPVFHIHHYQLAFAISLLLRDSSTPFWLAQMVALGIFVEGLSAFGAESLLSSGLCPFVNSS
jgi:hypothetical protein